MTVRPAERPRGSRFNVFQPEAFSNVRRWQDGYSPPVTRQESTAAPPAKFSILSLPRPFVTPPGIALPEFDDQGFPHGEEYEAILKAKTPSFSTRATLPGLKIKRRHEALSHGETGIQVFLWFHPYVVDMREQVGRFSLDAFNRAEAKGERMLRSDVMTIDLILTYVCPQTGDLRNHGVSIKGRDYQPNDEDLARERREQQSMEQGGGSWELLRADAVSAREYGNCGSLWSMVRSHDVPSLYWDASLLARALMKISHKGTLRDVLTRAANRRSISLDFASSLFAVAVAYGFLTLDHRAELRTFKPLYLLN